MLIQFRLDKNAEEKDGEIYELKTMIGNLEKEITLISARKNNEFTGIIAEKDTKATSTQHMIASLQSENQTLKAQLNKSLTANKRDSVLKLDFETHQEMQKLETKNLQIQLTSLKEQK